MAGSASTMKPLMLKRSYCSCYFRCLLRCFCRLPETRLAQRSVSLPYSDYLVSIVMNRFPENAVKIKQQQNEDTRLKCAVRKNLIRVVLEKRASFKRTHFSLMIIFSFLIFFFICYFLSFPFTVLLPSAVVFLNYLLPT